MEVYVEYAIIDNLVMDYILLKETAIILKEGFKRWRIFIAAVIGTICAIIFPLLKISNRYMFLLKVLSGLLIAFLAIDHKRFIGYVKYFNVFLLLTFVTGGAIIGVMQVIGIEYSAAAYKSAGVLPVGLNLLIGYILVITVKKLVKKSINGFITDRFKYKCILKKGVATLKLNAYFDSGNLLIDNKTGLPVVLCRRNVIEKLVKKGAVFSPPKYMQLETVSLSATVILYEIDCIMIETPNGFSRKNALLGITDKATYSEDLLIGAYIM